jgi:thiol-disulfide isomerase/thioredoxin
LRRAEKVFAGCGGMSLKEKVAVLISIAVGLVMLAAAVAKLANLPRFAVQLITYELMPEAWTPRVAFLVAYFELLLGAALLFRAYPRPALATATALVGVFLFAVAWGWVRGCLEECGCFGEMLSRSPAQAALEDVVLLGLLVSAYRWTPPVDPKRVVRRRQVFGVVSILILASMANGWGQVPSREEVSDAQVAGIKGRTVRSIPGYREAVPLPRESTIVVFLSTRCIHCARAVPRFNELYQKRGDMKFLAFAVDKDPNVQQFRKRFGAVFPILEAPRPKLRHLVHGVPEVLFISNHKVEEAWALPPTVEEVQAVQYRLERGF